MIERASKKECDSKNKGFSFEIGEPALAPGPEVWGSQGGQREVFIWRSPSHACQPNWSGTLLPRSVEGKQMQLVIEAVAVEGKQMEAASGGDFHN